MILCYLDPEPEGRTAYFLNVSDTFSFLVDFPESRKNIINGAAYG